MDPILTCSNRLAGKFLEPWVLPEVYTELEVRDSKPDELNERLLNLLVLFSNHNELDLMKVTLLYFSSTEL